MIKIDEKGCGRLFAHDAPTTYYGGRDRDKACLALSRCHWNGRVTTKEMKWRQSRIVSVSMSGCDYGFVFCSVMPYALFSASPSLGEAVVAPGTAARR